MFILDPFEYTALLSTVNCGPAVFYCEKRQQRFSTAMFMSVITVEGVVHTDPEGICQDFGGLPSH